MKPQPLTSAVHNAFANRCAELGIPVWLCDPDGAMVSAPEGSSNTLPSGEQALRLEEKRGAQVLSVSIALLPQCDSARQISLMLRWIHEDLVRQQHDQKTLGQFSERLAQSYEENQMLLGLSRALNRDVAATDIVQTICDGLREIMPFRWIGIRFAPSDQQVPDLSGKLVISGNPPCEVNRLELEIATMLNNSAPFPRLQPAGSTAIAKLVDSEVIAEPIMHDDQMIAVLIAGNKGGDDPGVQSFETQFLSAAAGFTGILHENIARFAEQEAQFLGTLKALTASIDAKDHYTRGHSERVAHLSWQMARAMKLEPTLVEQYRVAGMVHDVGKIGVPEAILCKPGRPTEEEYAKIRRHPEIGHEILRDIPKLKKSLPAVLHHHERWDGAGYPCGISGEAIPLLARVMALADAFDAMSSTRSYRPAMSRDRVLAEISRCAGSQFDPNLAAIFIRLDFRGFDVLVEKHRASERFAA
jgi:HD-GYP domain-containing protein (c-di-GMP phosphodiesterase class II)